jgi:nucleoid-associated protein YgaU
MPLALLGAALLVGGCASQPTEPAAEQAEQPSAAEQEARAAVEAAEKAVSKAQGASDSAVPEQQTLDLLDQARDHLDADEFEAATEAANIAKNQANDQLAAWRKEQEKMAAETEKAEPKTTMVAQGRLTAAPGADRGTYRVGRGDTLWDIAAADAIYGDPFAWPLIYKANSDRIEDADLIYPDQEFIIRWDMGGAAMDAAVRHAKTRGAWSLGEVEASDREYLQRH